MPKETLGCGEKLSRLEPERPQGSAFRLYMKSEGMIPYFFSLRLDGRAFKAEQGFRAVRAADLAARPLKDIAQIALLKFRDRGKSGMMKAPASDPDAVARLGDTSSSKGAFRMTAAR